MTDIRQRIRNALSILQAPGSRDPHTAPRTVAHAIETLRAADEALGALEDELDLVSAPDRNAAQELQRLRRELDQAREKAARLERELASTREELDIEKRVHQDERRKLADLEARAKKFDQVLLTDDEAFDRYMDRELGAQAKSKRKRAP